MSREPSTYGPVAPGFLAASVAPDTIRDPVHTVPSFAARLVWGAEHHHAVIAAVRDAMTSVWIATANLKDLYVPPRSGRGRWSSVLGDFDRLARDGVELRILHASLPSRSFRDAFDRFERLHQGGLQLRQCARVHLKLVVIDGTVAYIGSANWTGAGLGLKAPERRNFELGVVTRDERTLDEVQAHYDAIWTGRSCATCALRDVCEAPLDLAVGDRPGRTVVRIRPPG